MSVGSIEVTGRGDDDPVLIGALEAAGALTRGHYALEGVHTNVYFDKHKYCSHRGKRPKFTSALPNGRSPCGPTLSSAP